MLLAVMPLPTVAREGESACWYTHVKGDHAVLTPRGRPAAHDDVLHALVDSTSKAHALHGASSLAGVAPADQKHTTTINETHGPQGCRDSPAPGPRPEATSRRSRTHTPHRERFIAHAASRKRPAATARRSAAGGEWLAHARGILPSVITRSRARPPEALPSP